MSLARIVLLKDVNTNGFTFYTDYNSEENSNVALMFFLANLEKQVRIEGKSQKISNEVSRAYFESRLKSSQIGALAPNQSATIKNREKLEKVFEKYMIKIFPNQHIGEVL